MNNFIVIRLLFIATLLCMPFTSQATGASSANISMMPVTYTDSGIVLFKTYRHIDYTGAASNLLYSYWWLVVSASGTWEEVTYKILQQPDDNESVEKQKLFWKNAKQFDTEFDNDVNRTHPPKSLLPLIKKYGFKPRPDFNKNEGQGTVTWSSKGICVKDKCSKFPNPQRTLGNKTSDKAYTNFEYKDNEIVRKDGELVRVEVPPVPCIFYHAGVAVFSNGNYEIVDGKYETSDTNEVGAEFDFNRNVNAIEKIENINGEIVHSYDGDVIDYNYIDAIGIVPSELIQK
jgi:hypothetical protein